jgi:hypothetical protein
MPVCRTYIPPERFNPYHLLSVSAYAGCIIEDCVAQFTHDKLTPANN